MATLKKSSIGKPSLTDYQTTNNQNQSYYASVGIVCDVHRHMEGHHYAEISSVFGVNQEEFQCIRDSGYKIKPSKYDKSQDRYQIHCSPWSVMRLLASKFGYEIPVMPIGGLIQSDAGERRTCVFTIQRTH